MASIIPPDHRIGWRTTDIDGATWVPVVYDWLRHHDSHGAVYLPGEINNYTSIMIAKDGVVPVRSE